MLWASSIITMRQKHNETVLYVPFGFTRDYELIDDDLSTVSKISELSFPKGQCVRVSLSVPKFIS
jgi:hypothetical protein